MNTQDRYTMIEDREIAHKAAFNQGPRIGRVQVIRDNKTGAVTTVNFWFDSNGKLLYVR